MVTWVKTVSDLYILIIYKFCDLLKVSKCCLFSNGGYKYGLLT